MATWICLCRRRKKKRKESDKVSYPLGVYDLTLIPCIGLVLLCRRLIKSSDDTASRTRVTHTIRHTHVRVCAEHKLATARSFVPMKAESPLCSVYCIYGLGRSSRRLKLRKWMCLTGVREMVLMFSVLRIRRRPTIVKGLAGPA